MASMNKTSSFETVDELMPWLESREAEELQGWLREALEENSPLRQKLGRQAQRELGQTLDLTVLKRKIVQATAPPRGGFVDWRGAEDYCHAMESACVNPLDELLQEGHAAEVVELAEWVLKLTERASEHVQDCGEIGMIWDRLQALHLEACRRAKPDGVALAGRLFSHVISSGYYPFPEVVRTYQVHFGVAGVAEFKRLAEERLAGLSLPPPGPPEPDGQIPRRRAMAESKRREQQLQNIRELNYRRTIVTALLDQCRELDEASGV